MASWKGHLSFGILTGLGYAACGGSLFALSWLYSPLMFLAVVLGAFLPDLDSDTSVPARVLFRSVTLLGGALTGYVLFAGEAEAPITFFFGPATAMFIIYFIVFSVFRKLTVHRGIFHSVPAIIIASLISLYVFRAAKIHEWASFILAMGIGLGYFSHLFLDKMFSTVTLRGGVFKPTKSSGRPLKLWSKHPWVNLISFAILIGLFYLNADTLDAALVQEFNPKP